MDEAGQVEMPRRVAGVIVTHGQLATELLAAAEMIIGPVAHIAAISIGWHDDVDVARTEIERAIARVSEGGTGRIGTGLARRIASDLVRCVPDCDESHKQTDGPA